MKRGWWYSASTEDRLAQIDAAIELGMTEKQCAMNCGCAYFDSPTNKGGVVGSFARRHGRHFKNLHTTHRNRNAGMTVRNGARVNVRRARIEDAKQAYLSGEPVDMWSVE